jgi:hypothetical protein
MTTTAFSQRDPRWARDQLGTSSYTIAQAGCLITALASILVDFGIPTDPHRVNAWLTDHRGYANDCLLRFAAPAGLGADLANLVRTAPRGNARPAELHDEAARALAHGAAVLAEIHPPGREPDARHWLRLLSPLATSDWQCLDPWQLPGQEPVELSHAYPGAQLLTVAAYTPNHAKILPLAQSAGGPVQYPIRELSFNPQSTIRNPQ